MKNKDEIGSVCEENRVFFKKRRYLLCETRNYGEDFMNDVIFCCVQLRIIRCPATIRGEIAVCFFDISKDFVEFQFFLKRSESSSNMFDVVDYDADLM